MSSFRTHFRVVRSGIMTGMVLTAGVQAQILTNGSFESSLAGWSLPNTNMGVSYSIVTGGVDGTRYMAVSNRYSISDAPRQNVTSRLGASTNGANYLIRFHIQSAAPCSVRARLLYTDGTNAIDLILAEQMLEQTNIWTEVRGNRTLQWTNTPSGAMVYWEVGLIPESNYPPIAVDGLYILRDLDADGLSDAEETNSSPTVSDTDLDSLPDRWEFENGFSSITNEAAGDPDGDGFSTVQEYWAATDPHARFSFPGRPANPAMSTNARAILEYLALLPSQPSNRVIIGQHCSYPTNEFTNFFPRIELASGQKPGLLSLQFEDGGNPMATSISNTIQYADDYWTTGGLVLIKWQPRNPWTLKMASDTNQTTVDLAGLLDPSNGPPAALQTNLTARANYLADLAEVGDALADLKQRGLVILWRPCSEMNGSWFWHGAHARQDYIALWRHMYDYLTRERELNHLIWVYESDQGVHSGIPVDYYYPGDDVVDVFGHNLYDDTWELPFDSATILRRHPKVNAIPQAGPNTIRDGTWTNTLMLAAIESRYPRISFFAAWNSFTTGGNYLVHLAIPDNQGVNDLMNSPNAVSLDRLDWASLRRPMELAIEAGSNGWPQILWAGGNLQSATDPRASDWLTLTNPSFPFVQAPQARGLFRVYDHTP